MPGIDAAHIADIYADGIAEIELIGPNVRLTFFTWEHGQRVAVAKIVKPACTFQTDAVMIAQKMHFPAPDYHPSILLPTH